MALVCDEAITHAQIANTLAATMGKLLSECRLFDLYRSAQLGEGKKSLAYALTLQSEDHTLTDEECDKLISKALHALEPLGITLRS